MSTKYIAIFKFEHGTSYMIRVLNARPVNREDFGQLLRAEYPILVNGYYIDAENTDDIVKKLHCNAVLTDIRLYRYWANFDMVTVFASLMEHLQVY